MINIWNFLASVENARTVVLPSFGVHSHSHRGSREETDHSIAASLLDMSIGGLEFSFSLETGRSLSSLPGICSVGCESLFSDILQSAASTATLTAESSVSS